MATLTAADLNYKAILSERGGKFYFWIPEIRLTASGDDIRSAYEELQRIKQAFVDDVNEAGVADDLLPPRGVRLARHASDNASPLLSDLVRFAVKCAIVILLIGAASIAVISMAERSMRGVLQPRTTSVTDLVGMAAEQLQSMAPARREKLKQSLHILTTELEPYAAELRYLVTGNAAPITVAPGGPVAAPERGDNRGIGGSGNQSPPRAAPEHRTGQEG